MDDLGAYEGETEAYISQRNKRLLKFDRIGDSSISTSAIPVSDPDIGFSSSTFPLAFMHNLSGKPKQVELTSISSAGKVVAVRVFHLMPNRSREFRLLGSSDFITDSKDTWVSGTDGLSYLKIHSKKIDNIHVWYAGNKFAGRLISTIYESNTYNAAGDVVDSGGPGFVTSSSLKGPAIWSHAVWETAKIITLNCFLEP